ncbi:MAG: glycosyltransferase family 39 protein [Caldilineaceae bacterium]|nr:glycosyltransferase family 39 protein [Caldilineaceae bacterium]
MLKMTARPSLLRCAIFVAILALAAFVRFYCLTCSSLWHDEGNSWAVVQRSFDQIARDAAADIHPPGYYWLLKLWAGPAGFSAWGMRSLSALAGLLSVAVVYRIAQEMAAGTAGNSYRFARLAAFLAALSPFQVYYSQEARMYALLTLEGSVLMWSLFAMGRRVAAQGLSRSLARYAALYLLAAAAGLWTHYIFALLVAAAGGAAVWWWLGSRAPQRAEGRERGFDTPVYGSPSDRWKPFLLFLVLNSLALLAYSPWLPTGVERLLSWPSQEGAAGALEGLKLTLQTFAAGTIRTGPELAWGWLLLAAFLPICGLWNLRRSDAGAALILWLLLPLGAMAGFGLVSPPFLKFLLTLSPAWCLAAAACPRCLPTQTISLSPLSWFPASQSRAGEGDPKAYRLPLSSVAAGSIAALAAVLAVTALPPYYADPAARDNYAGIAQTVAALGDPDRDIVVLNAPGQADVWRFYDVGFDFIPLPADRPPDRAGTERTLEKETAERRRIFAVFWATEQSDRDSIVENWLGRHAFKGWENWQGNVRFATFSMPGGLTCNTLDEPHLFDDVAELFELCLSQEPLAPGETLMVGLRWRPLRTPDRRLKVTVQLLDARDQVIVQRDGEPAGGSLPTTAWKTGELITDNHGLSLPFGTPPGDYRLIAAVYDAETGSRLSVDSSDAVELARPSIIRPEQEPPVSIIPLQHRTSLDFGRLEAVGYSYHRKAFAHAPSTALSAGEMLQVTLYWKAPSPLPSDWPEDLRMRLVLGDQSAEAPLAGGNYPTGRWRAGELVRSAFEIQFDGSDPMLWLEVENTRKRLGRIPHIE